MGVKEWQKGGVGGSRFLLSRAFPVSKRLSKGGILTDVIVHIFAHLHTALHIKGKHIRHELTRAAKELVKLNTR